MRSTPCVMAAERIIGKLKEGGAAGGLPSFGSAAGNSAAAYPPTPAMKRFADSLVRQKGISRRPATRPRSRSAAVPQRNAPKKADGEAAGKLEPKPISPAQLLYARRVRGKGSSSLTGPKAVRLRCQNGSMRIEVPSAAGAVARPPSSPARSTASQSAGPPKRSRKRKAGADTAPPPPSQPKSVAGAPLRIPYGNKDAAMQLGARYGSAGWYAPPGVDLSPFAERGWL